MKRLCINPGDRFGKATVVNVRINYHGHTVAGCLCDCGNAFAATGTRLTKGKVTQCPTCSRPVLDPVERKLRQRESAYRHTAKRRGYVWELDRATFRKLLKDPCRYCGTEPAGGIDRCDNSLGYTLVNAVACCMDCNYAKLNKTEPEFLAWLRRVVLHQGISI